MTNVGGACSVHEDANGASRTERTISMAFITNPVLTIQGSNTVGVSDVTVVSTIVFDHYDVASDQPYHVHLDLVGLDASVGESGADKKLYFAGLGDVWASQGNLIINKTIQVGNANLNEDPTTQPNSNPDEIRAELTLTPLPAKVVGPVKSNVVKLQLQ